MKKIFIEGTVLFFSVLKWVFLSTLVGIVVGISTSAFIKLLNISISFSENTNYYFLLLPIAFFLSSFITQYLAPDAEGHGTEKVIEAVHKNSGKIKAPVVPVKLLATLITLASGGSVGKEGPCAQIGAGISSLLADLFRFKPSDRKKIVICGISAGFSSVFGTPIAGAIFGVEVLFVGSILYDVLLPSFISGIIAFQVSRLFGIKYFYHDINFVPVFSESFFLKIMLAGVIFGICAVALIETLQYFEKLSARIKIWKPLKGLIGGVILIALTFLLSKDYLGLGLNTIESALNGSRIIWYAFLIKILYTSISLGFGGSGGIVTPIFFIGAAAGSLYAQIMGLDPATFSAIGLVCLLSGATNAPIAASIMSIELFGPSIAPYASVAAIISFLIVGHRSVYPSQVLSFKKSASLKVQIGKVMEEVQPEIEIELQNKQKKWIDKFVEIGKNISKRTKK